jgi:hypothetical protein
VIVIGNEANPVRGYVLIEFIPIIDGLRLDDQAALHGRRIIKFDFTLQNPLGDQHAGVLTPLSERFASGVTILWKLELVGIPSLRRSYASE